MEVGDVGATKSVGGTDNAGGTGEADRAGLRSDVGNATRGDAQQVANRVSGDGNDAFKIRTVANGMPALRQGCVTTT